MRPFAWWGRMRVEGLEHVPADGPLLVAPNHDSQMDPVVIGLAVRPRRRLRYLAQAELWKIPGLGWFLNGMRQIPIRRGTGDSQGPGPYRRRAQGRRCGGHLSGGPPLVGRARARAERHRPARRLGARGPHRALHDRGHDRLRAVSEAAAGDGAVLSAQGWRHQTRRSPAGVFRPSSARAEMPRARGARRPQPGRRRSAANQGSARADQRAHGRDGPRGSVRRHPAN